MGLRRGVAPRGGCLGGRTGDDPLRGGPRSRGAPGPCRGPHHDGAADGHPPRPHCLGPGGRGRRLAGHLLALGRAHGRLRHGVVARVTPRRPTPAPQLPRARGVVAPPPGHRARAASQGLARGLCLRRLQRAVDHARLPALGEPLPLLQRRHRTLRARRRGRDRGGQPRRQAGRFGPCQRHNCGRRRPPRRVLSAVMGRTHVAGRPHHRDRGARHGHPGHADHQPGGDLRAAPRRAEPDQQRVHGLLLRRRSRRFPGRRGPVRHPRVGRRLPPRGGPGPADPGHVGLRPGAAGRPRSGLDISSPLPS